MNTLNNRKQKILVVEDSGVFRRLLTDFLSNNGFNVKSAISAVQSLSILKEETFDLVITDMNMPEMNGFELLLWMRKNNIDSKVIVITGTDSAELKEKFVDYGVIKYITKPVNFNYLLELISSLNKKGFTSNISNIDIFDYIKMATLSKKNKVISIIPPLEKEKGIMYFKNGELIHCKFKNQVGVDAFSTLVALKGGKIDEEKWEEPNVVSINIAFENLLLTSAQIMDESSKTNINEEYKLLILDDSIVVRKTLKNFFQKKGIKVTEVDSSVNAMKLLENEKFNIIFSDIERANDINAFEFLGWLQKNKVESKVVVITANSSPEFKEMAEINGAIKYYFKNGNLEELYSYVKEDNSSGFSGKINEINLFDYLQIATLSSKNRKLMVSSLTTDDIGYVYIKNKKIINVEYKNYDPEEAIYKIFCIPFGVINEEALDEDIPEKIESDSFKLFMRVIKKLEENESKTGLVQMGDNYIDDLENKIMSVKHLLRKTM
ncbi:MAG: response regulator [Cyanobacteriota bacterium]